MGIVSGGGGGGTFNGGTITDPLYVEPGTGDTLSSGIVRARSPYNEGNAQGNPVVYADTLDGSALLDVRDDGTFIYRSGDGSVSATFESQNQADRIVLGSSGGLQFITSNAVVFKVGPTTMGFFGTPAAAKPTVAGAKLPSDVVLASLLTGLAALGLVTDNST